MQPQRKKYPSDRMPKVIIRMPERLRLDLQRVAEREGRSMTAQAVHILERGLGEVASG